MKRLNKKSVILAALGLLIGSGAYLNYQMSKTDTTGMSDLTLANLEAMAFMDSDKDMDPDENDPDGYATVDKEIFRLPDGGVRVQCTCHGDGALSCC